MLNKNIASILWSVCLTIALLSVGVVFTGCAASNSEIKAEKTDPKELYDKAVLTYLEEDLPEAERLFARLMEDHPLSAYSQEAELLIGDVCYGQQKYDDAASYYTNFIAMHPSHPRSAYAAFQKGMSYLKGVLTIDRDQAATRKALFAFEDLLAGHPDSPYNAKAREMSLYLKKRLAERELYVADFYFKGENYKGALVRYRDVLKDYQGIPGVADKALYYIGESYTKLGETALARDAWVTLIKNFPDSPFTADANDRLRKG
ncbi:MAG: outer membrane protein assembly factor BamD [Deltaproteobacteria bacterium]